MSNLFTFIFKKLKNVKRKKNSTKLKKHQFINLISK